jgi:threonine synthase
MTAALSCIGADCGASYPVTDVIYNCPRCGELLDVCYSEVAAAETPRLKQLFRERRLSADRIDLSGVWRYRELFPFLDSYEQVVSLREGNTPLLEAPVAARYAGLDRLTFKHQGYNPTGSFKDNGMTCGVAQALRLGMRRVACVSTGNTSASMAAYAAAAGLDALVFLPQGNISFGKLAQALEYGARTFQIAANFDQILALVRGITDRAGIYLLNSVNPFRIEGQKSIAIEMMDQRDWSPPDWIVLPGGNLGNVSAIGKGLREMRQAGFISRLPRLAVIQAEGAAPFFEFMRTRKFQAVADPHTFATAIKIGDPVSWPKAAREIEESNGAVEKVSEQEIADAKAVIGRAGIGCEPASAATLAGIRKLVACGVMSREADVTAILTGHLLKDPDYIYGYHTGKLEGIRGAFANAPVEIPNDPEKLIERIL